MEEYLLSNEGILQACRQADAFFRLFPAQHRDLLRLNLALEEALLRLQERFGTARAFTLRRTKRWNRPRLEVTLRGASFNPLLSEGDEAESTVLPGLLAAMNQAPAWQYSGGVNILIFSLPHKKRSPLLDLGVSIGAALALGLAGLALPPAVRDFICNQLLGKLSGAFLGLLTGLAGPMIFLSVAWGIYGIGDTATLNRVGSRMISRFLLLTLAAAILSMACLLPFFPIATGGGFTLGDSFSDLFDMVLAMVPGNLLAPFLGNNPMQIIFIAVVFALALLILGKKTAVVASFTEQANYIMQSVMSVVSSLVPLYIFISLTQLIMSRQLAVLTGAYKLLLLNLLGAAVIMAAYTAWVCLKMRIAPLPFLKKLLPTFLIAITTASSAAAFATNLETCERKLGIDKTIVNFGVPFGQVVFMPLATLLFSSVGLFMAEAYGVAITPAWLVSVLLISVVLAIAAPPIPGGALTCYAILFAQLGIPAEALAVTIAFNMLLDFISTSSNLFCLQCDLTLLADSLGMQNKAVLRRPD